MLLIFDRLNTLSMVYSRARKTVLYGMRLGFQWNKSEPLLKAVFLWPMLSFGNAEKQSTGSTRKSRHHHENGNWNWLR